VCGVEKNCGYKRSENIFRPVFTVKLLQYNSQYFYFFLNALKCVCRSLNENTITNLKYVNILINTVSQNYIQLVYKISFIISNCFNNCM